MALLRKESAFVDDVTIKAANVSESVPTKLLKCFFPCFFWFKNDSQDNDDWSAQGHCDAASCKSAADGSHLYDSDSDGRLYGECHIEDYLVDEVEEECLEASSVCLPTCTSPTVVEPNNATCHCHQQGTLRLRPKSSRVTNTACQDTSKKFQHHFNQHEAGHEANVNERRVAIPSRTSHVKKDLEDDAALHGKTSQDMPGSESYSNALAYSFSSEDDAMTTPPPVSAREIDKAADFCMPLFNHYKSKARKAIRDAQGASFRKKKRKKCMYRREIPDLTSPNAAFYNLQQLPNVDTMPSSFRRRRRRERLPSLTSPIAAFHNQPPYNLPPNRPKVCRGAGLFRAIDG